MDILRKLFLVLGIVFLMSLVLTGCGDDDKKESAKEETTSVAQVETDLKVYMKMKDEYDVAISAIAKDINTYLSSHADFKNGDELINRAENQRDKIKQTSNDLASIKTDDIDLQQKLKKCFEYEFTRIDGLCEGMKKSREGGDFGADFKRGGEAAEAFAQVNEEIAKKSNSASIIEPKIETMKERPVDPNKILERIDLPTSNSQGYKMGNLTTPINSSRPTSYQRTEIVSPYGKGKEILVDLIPDGNLMTIQVAYPVEDKEDWYNRTIPSVNGERISVFAIPIYSWTNDGNNGKLYEVITIVRLDNGSRTTELYIFGDTTNSSYSIDNFQGLQQAGGTIIPSVNTAGNGQLSLRAKGTEYIMIYDAKFRCLNFK